MSDRLDKSIVDCSATIADAMRSLEESNTQIVLVVDDSRRTLGAVTDGDLRRALLADATLASSVAGHMNRRFLSVGPEIDRAKVVELMQARQIFQVPVLDEQQRVVGLHLLREMLDIKERPNWAVVMVGGKGKRLGNLTEKLPKPMLPVAGRPILERIILQLVGSGIREIFLAVNHMADTIEAHFRNGQGLGCEIQYLREAKPLGTGGALSLIADKPKHPVLVMNGDLVTQMNFGAIIDYHERAGNVATMAVRKYYHRVPYGCVDVDGQKLVRLVEKPTSTHLINAGVYVLDPSVLNVIEPQEQVTLPSILKRLIDQDRSIGVCEIDEDWIDVGHREQLNRARGSNE